AEVKKQLDAETRKLDAALPAWEKTVARAALPRDIQAILAVPAAKRNNGQRQKLLAHHRKQSKTWVALDSESRALTAKMPSLVTTTPILRETRPRVTHIQLRGNYLARAERVEPGLPAVFPAPPRGAPLNRLTLAKWLVDENNPLTARVAVNRLW